MRYLTLVSALGIVSGACAVPRDANRPATAYDATVAGAMAAHELARGAEETVTYGWHLEFVGDRARYSMCSAEDACTQQPVEAPAASVVGTKIVRRTRPMLADGTNGEEVDVLRLTFSHEVKTTRGGSTSDSRGILVR